MTYKEFTHILNEHGGDMLNEMSTMIGEVSEITKELNKTKKSIDVPKNVLKHILQRYIVGITYVSKSGQSKVSIVCSNKELIKRFKNASGIKTDRISTGTIRKTSILTWNLLINEPCEIETIGKNGKVNYKFITPSISLNTKNQKMLQSFLEILLKNPESTEKQITKKITNTIQRKKTEK